MANIETFTPFSVEDTSGRRYNLVRMIGKGGQGKVYIEENSNYLVKILKNEGSISVDRLRNQIRRIRQLDLANIPITRPLEILRPPTIGYVMEFLNGMQPIENLLKQPKNNSNLIGWYISTGGLRRRLKLLEKCADALHRLHSKGLVYCDISPKNIYVSEATDETNVYLIDVDNLIIETNTAGFYTKWYAAPEVFRREHGNDSLTDVFSFAVVAYKTLAIDHPLLGDNIRDGDPDIEQQALIGDFPWIHHPVEDFNRSSAGLSSITEKILSKGLMELFQRTFNSGLNDRQQRPSMSEWSRGLNKAYQFTIICNNCQGSFYTNSDECPWCGAKRPNYVLAAVDVVFSNIDQTKTNNKPNEAGFCFRFHEKVVLTRKMLGYPDDKEQPIIEIESDGEQISISVVDGGEYYMTADNWDVADGNKGPKARKLEATSKEFAHNWQFHFGELLKDHRRIRFISKKGGK